MPLLQANETPLLLFGAANSSLPAANSTLPAEGSQATQPDDAAAGEALPVTGEQPAPDRSGAGITRVAVLLADLSFGNFTKHPAFPILMANLVEFTRQAPAPPGFHTGQAIPLPAAGSYQSIQVIPPGQAPLGFAQSWPSQWEQTLEPGVYRFRFTRANGESAEFAAGAWAGEANELDLRPRAWTSQAGTGSGSRPSATEDEAARRLDLRPWLLAAAVLLLLGEAYLAWRR